MMASELACVCPSILFGSDNQNIRRFNIKMKNALVVGVLDRQCYVTHEFDNGTVAADTCG